MSSGCLHWNGTPEVGGYGTVKVGGRAVKAHRHAWALHNGPVPDGMRVLHKCDNRICVNPEHLFLGTNADNMRDMSEKGRAAGFTRRGERHPMVKVTDAQVREIRERFIPRGPGGNSRRLAEEYGVSMSTILSIARGVSRGEVGGPVVARIYVSLITSSDQPCRR